MKKFWTLLMGFGLAIMLAIPALAADIRGRIKSIDADKGVITLTSKQQDQEFTLTADTKYLTVKGDALANGLKSGDLKAGARVTITYDTKDGKNVASQVQIRAERKKTQ